jgi:hypothetical protein
VILPPNTPLFATVDNFERLFDDKCANSVCFWKLRESVLWLKCPFHEAQTTQAQISLAKMAVVLMTQAEMTVALLAFLVALLHFSKVSLTTAPSPAL